MSLAGVTTWASISIAAQDDPKPPDEAVPPAAETGEVATFPPYRRVPSYFGMVGLSDQQRSDIYVVRGRYQSEIAELKQRIEQLSSREMSECEAVLTEAQRKILAQIRDARRPTLTTEGN